MTEVTVQRQAEYALDELDWVQQLLADFATPVPPGTDPSTHLSAVLRDAVEVGRRLDEWIVRTVKAEDAVKHSDRVIGRLHAELDQARAAHHRQGDQLARQHTEITGLRERVAIAEARAAGRCARCGRTAATHLLIRTHSFVRPQREGRSNG